MHGKRIKFSDGVCTLHIYHVAKESSVKISTKNWRTILPYPDYKALLLSNDISTAISDAWENILVISIQLPRLVTA
jgi:hypothetical protein